MRTGDFGPLSARLREGDDGLRRKAFRGAAAFLMTESVYLQLLEPSGSAGKRFVWLAVFVGFWLLIRATEDFRRRGGPLRSGRDVRRAAAWLGGLLAACLVLGRRVQVNKGLGDLKKEWFPALLTLAGAWLALYFLLAGFFGWLARRDEARAEGRRGFFQSRFLYAWLLIFGVWVLYLCAFYPGILSQDSMWQIDQIEGVRPLSNHHPLIHTGWIALFYRLGKALLNPDFGVFLYSLSQLTVLSLICAYAVRFLARRGLPSRVVSLVLGFFAFFPINGVYSVTMWKDVLFGGFTLLAVLLLFDMADDSARFFASPARVAALGGALFLFCTFRNNGLFAFLLFMPVLFFAMRRHWRPLLAAAASALVLAGVYLGPVMDALRVQPTTVGESLSVPLQQLARTVKEHRDGLSEQELSVINEILPVDALADLYNPELSDNVKFNLRNEIFMTDPGRYLSLWFRLFFRFPKTYVESFLANSYGYWYPDVDYWIYFNRTIPNERGITELTHPWASRLLIKAGGQLFSKLPVVSLLASCGMTVWLLAASAAACAFRRRRRLLLPYALLFTLWLTLLASPVFAEYRYTYALVLSCPVCIALSWFSRSGNPPMETGSATPGPEASAAR